MSVEESNTVEELLDEHSVAEVNDHLEGFHIASNPTHFRILYALYPNEKAGVGVLVDEVSVSEDDVVETSKELVNAGLIRSWEFGSADERDGKYYELSPVGKNVLAAIIQYF